MTRILAYSLPWLGHVFPLVPTLLELQRRGHDVALATHPRIAGLLRGAGVPLCDTTFDYDDSTEQPSVPQWQDEVARQREGCRRLGEPAASELARLTAAHRPDFLIVDSLIWGAMVFAESSGLPWAAAAHTCITIPTRGRRLLGPGLAPPTRLRDRLRQRVMATYLAFMNDHIYLPETNRLRTAHGLPPVLSARERYCQPPLTLAFTAEPFEYPRTDWHQSVCFVGPALWEPPGPLPPWLDALDDRPLVLVCTSSSSQPDTALVETALAALAGGAFQVVATAPSGTGPLSTPPGAWVEPYVPHGRLLPRAACVVCHGGAGITQKALAAGVPVVAVPFGRDQFEVARRVEVAGVGVRLPAAELDASRLRAAVDEAIRRRPNVERIASAFRRSGGAAAAADAIEARLSVGSRQWAV